jgi:flavodoxin
MKIAIIYFSKFGNNKISSEKLSFLLQERGAETEIFSAADKLPKESDADLFVFSSPTRMGNPPGKIKKAVTKLSPKTGAGYAVVNTCAGAEQTKVPVVLGGLAEEAGLKKAAEGLLLIITDMKGPLEEGYEEKLKSFAGELLKFKSE